MTIPGISIGAKIRPISEQTTDAAASPFVGPSGAATG